MARTRSHKESKKKDVTYLSPHAGEPSDQDESDPEVVIALLQMTVERQRQRLRSERALREHWHTQWFQSEAARQQQQQQQTTSQQSAGSGLDSKTRAPPAPPPATESVAVSPSTTAPVPSPIVKATLRQERFHPGPPNRFAHYSCCAREVCIGSNNSDGCQIRWV